MLESATIEQTPHEIIPMISDEVLLHMSPEEGAALVAEREESIRLSKEDPLGYGYEPPMWARMDLEVARRRLELGPNVVITLVVLGGIRAGKTHFAAKRLDQHLVHGVQPWVWAMHETEPSSQTIGQRWVNHYLPAQFKTASGKSKGAGTRLNYEEGKGFTGMQFRLAKALCEFKVYGGKLGSLQGAELSMAWADELVPKDVAKTARERTLTRAKDLRDPALMRKVKEAVVLLESGQPCPAELLAVVYHGVVILTFTPKEGYSPMVAEVLDGAITTEVRKDVPLLPGTDKHGKPKTVPLLKRGRKPGVIIAYLHSDQNAFGNYEGLCAELQGANEDRIRIDAYGDVNKAWSSRLPKFNDQVHVIPLSAVPRSGTFYHRVDPCDTRNFFMTWWLVSGSKHYCVREWPQLDDYIPGVGDPGEWAVSSESKKFDGDMGTAQEGFGFGLEDYKAEIARVELELGAWFYGLKEGDKPRAIEVYERHMDSRFGNTPTAKREGNTTMIEEFEDIDLEFLPAPGEHLAEGIKLIETKLKYDESRPIDSLNCPKYYIVEHCAAMIFAHQNWTGKDGDKGACKDPIDTARYHFLADPPPEDLSREIVMAKRGRGSAPKP
jgi:hypothetical protein